jgi:hypothetical protein
LVFTQPSCAEVFFFRLDATSPYGYRLLNRKKPRASGNKPSQFIPLKRSDLFSNKSLIVNFERSAFSKGWRALN